MRTFISLLYKDFLLLARDKAGLCMIFLMPTLLVVIMTYLQNSTFNVIHETRIPLLLLNQDTDSLGLAIEQQIAASGIFSINKTIEGEPQLVEAVSKGKATMGIVIPANTTEQIRRNVKRYVADIFHGTHLTGTSDSIPIRIYIDPTAKASFRNTLMSALREHAVRTESDFLFNEITTEVGKISPLPIANIHLSRNQVIFDEQYAMPDNSKNIPNSTQHNVPAWSVFAIFFITISLSGNMIKEREEGSFIRLLTAPCPYILYLLSKAAVYLLVCLLQLLLIFLMGIHLFPHLGLPALSVGPHPTLLPLLGICAALSAIGYGIAIGKIATSYQQAAIFASISTVILAAIGGIWIPIFAMPPFMQWLSKISPLNWGLEGFYDLLIRHGGLTSILPESGIALAFAVGCTLLAILYHRKKQD
jgi:ABC-2 type transport system permease protein